ncbi:MAG: DUF1175 family protein, partial [Gammaproteobacteria bacterium]|nr:DUF1175 family protein [Gammaproteobacteria bacterium]
QSRGFRAWMTRIVLEQVRQGPSPRWAQRDCASLVRFAVAETLRPHDTRWMRANGLSADQLPADLVLTREQRGLRHAWRLQDGSKSAYVGALTLIQENSRYIAKDINAALPGDLLFFDQGDDQHLMVWTPDLVVYHTGTTTTRDNGLRAVPIQKLLRWKDTRWRPTQDNPNFVGVYRLAFLAY